MCVCDKIIISSFSSPIYAQPILFGVGQHDYHSQSQKLFTPSFLPWACYLVLRYSLSQIGYQGRQQIQCTVVCFGRGRLKMGWYCRAKASLLRLRWRGEQIEDTNRLEYLSMILYPIVLCEVERWRVLLDSEHSILYSKYVQVPNFPQSESLIPMEVFSRNKSTAQKVLVYMLFPFHLLTVLPINFLFGMWHTHLQCYICIILIPDLLFPTLFVVTPFLLYTSYI